MFVGVSQFGYQLYNTITMTVIVTYAACEVPRTQTKKIMSQGVFVDVCVWRLGQNWHTGGCSTSALECL